MRGNMERKVNPVIGSYIEAFQLSLEYARNTWDTAITLYELWRLKKFAALERTHSKIAIHLHHSMVQDRAPKILNNVWSDKNLVSLKARSPQSEPFKEYNELWLRDLLAKQNLMYSGLSTVQMSLIAGTAYRLPTVTWSKTRDSDRLRPVIGTRNLDFFSVLPAPKGGQINPDGPDTSNCVPWVFVIDTMPESKMKKLAEKGIFDKEAVGKMLDSTPGRVAYPEDQYKDQFNKANAVSFGGSTAWRNRIASLTPIDRERRIVHWLIRGTDKHYIIGEDAFLLYDGPPEMLDEHGNAVWGLSKYVTCPDGDNWFGIPFLQTVDDMLRAIIMNTNLRFDNLIQTIFPVSWYRDDIVGSAPLSSFRRRPFDIKKFPMSVKNISEAIYHDHGKDIPQQAFLDEDRLKAMLQKVAGAAETTSSLGDVIGNKTATGVTTIMNEIMGRPMMESIAFEMGGFKAECEILMHLAREFVKDSSYVRAPNSQDGFPWAEIPAEYLTDDWIVETHGTQYLQEKNIQFQKMMAFFPFINNSPVWNQYDAHRDAAKIADIFPDVEKDLNPIQPAASMGAPAAPGGMGGAASMMDSAQRSNNSGPAKREMPAGAAL